MFAVLMCMSGINRFTYRHALFRTLASVNERDKRVIYDSSDKMSLYNSQHRFSVSLLADGA